MAFRHTTLGAAVTESPKEAAKTIAAEFKRHDGYATSVAETLGVDIATLNRWLRKLSDAGFDVREIAKTPARRYRASEKD
jgi:DNA-binding MarR family transcriptional regulator